MSGDRVGYMFAAFGGGLTDHMRTELVVAALETAARARASLAGVRMHTDHGRQYTSSKF